MKKLIVLFLSIIILTGCGKENNPNNPENPSNPSKPNEPNSSEKLTCKMIEDSEGIKLDIIVISNYNEDKSAIQNSSSTMTLTVSGESKDFFPNIKEDMVKNYDGFQNLKGYTISITDNNVDVITIKTIIDYPTLDETSMKALDIKDKNESYEKTKSEYLELGYTCE